MSRTVVIVDDHIAFRRQARAMLEDEGFQVVGEAADGKSAVDTILALRPDVVLLDVQLPDANGFDVTAQLEEKASGAVVVLTSGRDAGDYRARLMSSSARGFIAKSNLSASGLRALLSESR